MVVLALDTTTRAGSVAIVIDDRIVDERVGDDRRTHAERLPAELLAVAADNGVALPDVGLFAVACGPGWFTGLRIGIATIQGLALVTGRRIAAISALEAMAAIASRSAAPDTLVAAWMDAHRRDIFAALYRVAAGSPFDPARLQLVDPPTVEAPVAVLARWRERLRDADAIFVGDGAVMYGDVIASVAATARVTAQPMLAGAIGRLATARARSGEAIEPGDVRPLYVRRPDAETARERAAATRRP
jgi:tRNA threonylcarbamoyladenosine biosynthesis protein TsaB